MKIKGLSKYLSIVTLIELVLLWIDVLPQAIVFCLEEKLSLARARNKMLSNHLLKVEYRAMASPTCELMWVK